MTTGEGGMIVTDDAAWDALFRSLRNQGRDVFDGWLTHTRLGDNYRLPPLGAARPAPPGARAGAPAGPRAGPPPRRDPRQARARRRVLHAPPRRNGRRHAAGDRAVDH